MSIWQKVGVLVFEADMNKAYDASVKLHKAEISRASIERGVPYHEWVNGTVLFPPALTKQILAEYEYVDVSLALEAVTQWWKGRSGHPSLKVALIRDNDGDLVFILSLVK